MDWLYENYPIVVRALLSAFVLYVILITYVRVNGLRSFAEISSTDLVVTVLIGNVLSTSIMYDDQSILKGALIVAVLLLIQNVFSRLKRRSPAFDSFARNQPVVLIKNGRLLHNNLKKTLISKDDLRYKLREAGVTSLQEVNYVVFETTGDITVLQKAESVDEFILGDLVDDDQN